MYIILNPLCRQAFLRELCRRADPFISLRLQGAGLELGALSPDLASAALAQGAFPAYERLRLQQLAPRALTGSSLPADELISTACGIIDSDVGERSLFRGPGHQNRMGRLLSRLLQEDRYLDFDGFCRFRLPGLDSYLRLTLDLAADELLMQDEAQAFRRLLTRTASGKTLGPRLRLSFRPGGLFELQGNGHREGGVVYGREDALIAEIILRRPALLQLSGCAWAPLELTSLLEDILGKRLTCLD